MMSRVIGWRKRELMARKIRLGVRGQVSYSRRMIIGKTATNACRILIAALTVLMVACSAPPRPPATVIMPRATRWKMYQSGIASWYHDRRTASGERFIASDFSAAHRKLPFGTLVRVTAVRTGRSCVVRINDRGPFVRGRILDVSPAAGKMLGLDSSGIAKVNIEIEVK
jgi:rare lipoprotein A